MPFNVLLYQLQVTNGLFGKAQKVSLGLETDFILLMIYFFPLQLSIFHLLIRVGRGGGI